MSTSVPKQNPRGPSESEERKERDTTPLHHVLGAMCDFLQIYFGQKPPGTWRWQPDPKVTDLHITSDAPLNRESRGDRPAIVVMVVNCSQMNMGLDDQSEKSMLTGIRTKRLLYMGNFSLQCLSRIRAESQDLAFMTQEVILANRDILQRKWGFFQIGQGINIGQTTPPGSMVADDGGEGLVSTPVGVPFYFPWSIRITPLNRPVLRQMSINLRTAEPPCLETGPGPEPPGHLLPGGKISGPGTRSDRLPPQGLATPEVLPKPVSRPPRPRKGDLPKPACGVGALHQPLLVRVRVL